MRWRGMVAAWLVATSVPVNALLAQGGARSDAPRVDPACACHAREEPGEPGGEIPGGRDRKWAVAGAVGLALLTGIPFGGRAVEGLPFAAAPAPSDLPIRAIEVAGGMPEGPTPAAPPEAGMPAPLALEAPPREFVPLAEQERAGIIPPKTATHLPLLAAAGVLMLGGGTLLARRNARDRRRRRRFVAL